MAITKQDIWCVADELDAEGTRPTLAAVRQRLGKGSYTTIQEAMKEWQGRQIVTAPPADPLPSIVTDRLNEAGATIWAAALEAAHSRLDDEHQQLAAEREALEQRMTEATELADALAAENEGLRVKFEEFQSSTKEELADRDVEIKAAQAEVREQSKIALEARERAANLEGQLSALRERFEALEPKPTKKPTTEEPAEALESQKPGPTKRPRTRGPRQAAT